MARILILTESYPFPKGDDYLTDEIGYWADGADEVVVVPARVRPNPHPLPAGVSLDLGLAELRTRRNDTWFTLRAVLSSHFRREVVRLWRRGRLRPGPLLSSLRTIARTLRAKRGLDAIIASRGVIDLAYSYWFDAEAFAAALCKEEGRIRRLVSRAHGFDVYAHRRPGGGFPVKDDVIHHFDRIYAVSDHGADYLRQHHQLPADVVRTSRLGVRVPTRLCPPAEEGRVHLLSIAYCVGLKRIDKMVDALGALALRHPRTAFAWTHVGDGPLLTELNDHAARRLVSAPNVTFKFLGGLAKDEVLAVLSRGPVDVFVNTSDTEGLPVSVMEAMSFGIPSVAPEVGGIPEIVRAGTGWLLPSHPTVDAIVDTLERNMESMKSRSLRESAHSCVSEDFDADRNYSLFVRECRALVDDTNRSR